MDLSALLGLAGSSVDWTDAYRSLAEQYRRQFGGCVPPGSYCSPPPHVYMAIDPAAKPKENVMEISFDFNGGVKLIDGHFIVKAGCKTAICHTPKEVAEIIQKQMEEHFKGKYKKK